MDNTAEWSEEMWQIWNVGSGIFCIGDLSYEYGFDDDREFAWLKPEGNDSPVVFADIKRDDPVYVNGTDLFRKEVEAVRMIDNLIKAKTAAGKIMSAE
ncbi:MAG TPA: hypothetical protein DD405_02985 [Desulfobacteraceae bacterium]|nr:hypothetical protein [Desulfobacteraceae bacterium]